MSEERGGRRYDEEELALILRKAYELQEGERRGPRHGTLDLREIEEIASEVGIDPAYVQRAATLLPTDGRRRSSRLLGGPTTWRYEGSVPGEVDEEGFGRTVDAIRSLIGKRGEVEEVFGRLEWSHDDGAGPVHVRVVPRDGRTRVEVEANRAGEATVWFVLAPLAGFVAGAVLVGLFGVEATAARLALVAGGMASSLLGARAAWSHVAGRWEEKLRRTLEQALEEVRALTAPAEPRSLAGEREAT